MDKKVRATVTAAGHWVPEKVMSNADFEKLVDTNDEWIRTRTGIRERRYLEDGKASAYMAEQACKIMFEKYKIDPDTIDLILFATVTPDMVFPQASCLLQGALKMNNAWGFDLNAACCSFLYALTVGSQFIESGNARKVLVVGSDKMSSIVNKKDRNTCILFGDGCGVVLLEPSDDDTGILDFYHYIDGSGAPFLGMPAGGSLRPASHETVDNNEHYIFQDGKTVYQNAVKGMAEVSIKVLEQNGFSGSDVDLFVPHQANKRIIDSAVSRLGLDESKVAINIDRYGNTTSATLPICISEAVDSGRVKKGDLVVITSFGAGFTAGSLLMRWSF